MAVNRGRIIMGGLAAGLTANVLDYLVFSVVLKDRLTQEMNALNPALNAKMNSAPSMATAIVGDFVIGILLVWIYAAMRAAYGPGPRTAMRAGLCIWVLFAVVYSGLTATGLYSWAFFCSTTGIELVTTMIVALVGGAVYKE